MGKIRIKELGDEEKELEEKKKAEEKREAKKEEESSDIEVNPTEEVKEKKTKKEKFAKKKQRSANYSSKLMEIDKNKVYSLDEALELLRKVKLAKFDETVELHINTTQSLNASVKLPHGTGKETVVRIADDALLAEVEGGKINFDVLIADPSMMPKLAKVAKVLGPRGLMPNPKAGTISDNPEEAMKKFQGGQMSFKTEAKAPIVHISVGKASFKDDQLKDNIKMIIQTIRRDRIKKVVIKSTMSPAIRLQV